MLRLLAFLVSLGARAIRAMCRRRADLVLANLALRQQVAVLKKHRPRPTLGDTDRGVPIALLRCPTTAPRDRPVRIDSVLIMMSHSRLFCDLRRRELPTRTSGENHSILIMDLPPSKP